MKVMLSVEALTPVLSGIGRYTWELVSRLHEQLGVEDVRFFRNGKWVTEPASLLRSVPLSGTVHKRSFLRHLKLKPPRWYADRRLKNDCQGKIFHGPNYFLPSCADFGVATIHDLSIFKFPETHPADRIRHFERDFSRSMSVAAHLITDSEVTRQEVIEFLRWPSERITAVPLGVSKLFLPRAKADLFPVLARHGLTETPYTLCVSTLEPRKRVSNLLAAYRRLPIALRTRHPLVLVGGAGWLSEDLHQEIYRSVNEGWLRHLGFVPEVDLPFLYAGARLFAYPSIYEGFGLPVLEAMASGVPVITSNRSSLPEVMQGAGFLVDPDDVDALVKSIEMGLQDNLWREEAKSRGLCVAKTYSWEKCVAQTARVYESLL